MTADGPARPETRPADPDRPAGHPADHGAHHPAGGPGLGRPTDHVAGRSVDAIALGAPAAAPLDEFTRARLASMLLGYFGDVPALDEHLNLLDVRGAWYAEHVMAAWPATLPDAFFGLVAHVVRTQLPGPAQPALDAWIAAGTPTDPVLAARWEQIRVLKNLDGGDRPAGPRAPDATPEGPIAALDHAVSTWPTEHWARFLLAYVKLDITLARRGIALPPIGT